MLLPTGVLPLAVRRCDTSRSLLQMYWPRGRFHSPPPPLSQKPTSRENDHKRDRPHGGHESDLFFRRRCLDVFAFELFIQRQSFLSSMGASPSRFGFSPTAAWLSPRSCLLLAIPDSFARRGIDGITECSHKGRHANAGRAARSVRGFPLRSSK